jgi:hypothetical protein
MEKKKAALLAISLVFVTVQGSAQFTTGLKAGLNMSDVYFDISALNDETDFRKGWNIGVFGNYMLNDKFDVQAELLYSQQGYNTDIPVTDAGGTSILDGFKFQSHYLNVPVLLNFYPVKRIYIEAGPQVGFRLGRHYSAGEKEWSDALNELEPKKISTDFSLAGGIGLCLGNGFTVNARYCHGLLKEAKTYNNRVIQFSIAYDLWSF